MKRLLIIILGLPLVIQAQETKTSIGFNFYPSYSDVHYMTWSSVDPIEVKSVNQMEQGMFTFSGNIFFRHELSKRFDLSWGIGYRDVGFKSHVEVVIPPQGTEEYSNSTFRQGYLQFPISVNFNIIDGLYVTAGVIPSAIMDADYKQQTSSISNGIINLSGGDPRNLRTFQFSSTAGIGYSLKLTDQWRFYAEPSFSYCLTSQQAKEAFDRSPWRVGANLGFVHRF